MAFLRVKCLTLTLCPLIKNFTDKESVDFLKDETVKAKLASAKKLSDVDYKAYDAIFYVGGHGPVIDLASDPVNIKLASDVCHFECFSPLDEAQIFTV